MKVWEDFPLEVGKNEIDAVEATCIINTRVGYEIKDRTRDDAGSRWWKVSILSKPDANNSNNRERIGWVCEANHPLVEVTTPWAWPGFEIQKEDTTKPVEWCEKQLDKELMADNALLKQLFDIIDLNNNGRLEPGEIRSAWKDSSLVHSLSRQIIPHDNEWGVPMAEWDKIDCKLTEDDEKKVWTIEKERYSKLRFWDDTSSIASFPASFNVYHIHPLGLIENFSKLKKRITFEMVKRVFTSASNEKIQDIVDYFNVDLERYKLDTALRLSHFFAQVAVEAFSDLSAYIENLNYSVQGLKDTYSVFSPNGIYSNVAQQIGRVPGTGGHPADQEAIANYAYANTLGNGPFGNGNGWLYRGRGMKQLTGWSNYQAFRDKYPSLFDEQIEDVVANPEVVFSNRKYAVRSGIFFWVENRVYEKADGGSTDNDVRKVTRIVNGPGLKGLDNRQAQFRRIYHQQRIFAELDL